MKQKHLFMVVALMMLMTMTLGSCMSGTWYMAHLINGIYFIYK